MNPRGSMIHELAAAKKANDRVCYPVLCQNLIHWQRYKRAVDAAWTVGPATIIEQSYPPWPGRKHRH